MSGISTHVLDTASGSPAAGIAVTLHRLQHDLWVTCASASTNTDGRIPELLPAARVLAGRYRLTFVSGAYFQKTLYPEIIITFDVDRDGAGYHLPLLLNPFGYTTYRGT